MPPLTPSRIRDMTRGCRAGRDYWQAVAGALRPSVSAHCAPEPVAGQARQGRRERGLLSTRATEDAASRRPAIGSAVVVLHLSLRYLLKGNREVVFRRRFDHRGRELVEGALTEVVVVAVDLTGALGGDDDTGVV